MANESAEKETKPTDPQTESDAPVNIEHPTPDGDHDDTEEETRWRKELSDERVDREELKRTQSHATDTSTITRTTTRASVPAKSNKPWYKTPNPLLWGSVPPVPKEKQESREANAGFFSKLTFHWMAPLMNVSKLEKCNDEKLFQRKRRDIPTGLEAWVYADDVLGWL